MHEDNPLDRLVRERLEARKRMAAAEAGRIAIAKSRKKTEDRERQRALNPKGVSGGTEVLGLFGSDGAELCTDFIERMRKASFPNASIFSAGEGWKKYIPLTGRGHDLIKRLPASDPRRQLYCQFGDKIFGYEVGVAQSVSLPWVLEDPTPRLLLCGDGRLRTDHGKDIEDYEVGRLNTQRRMVSKGHRREGFYHDDPGTYVPATYINETRFQHRKLEDLLVDILIGTGVAED